MSTAVAIHAGIHDPKVDSLQFCEHADCRSAVQEIRNHLRGNFAWIRADTTIRDTMVRGEHDTHWSNNLDAKRSLNGTHLRGERFEPPQRTAGFRQYIEAPVGCRSNCLVNRRNRAE